MKLELTRESVESEMSLEGSLLKLKKIDPEVMSPNEFLIATFMDKEVGMDLRIKAAQAAKKDNKSDQPVQVVQVVNGQPQQPEWDL